MSMVKNFLIAVALVGGATTARAENARSSSCSSNADASMAFVARVQRLAVDPTNAEVRDSLQLPQVSDTAVVLVSDSLVCAQAQQAMTAVTAADGDSAPSSVVVVRAGNLYAVLALGTKVGEFTAGALFDGQFQLISKIAF